MPLKVTTEVKGLGADVAAFRNLRHRLALDDGLSIIGVAIASLIMLVSLIPAASLFTAATVTSVSGQARVIASNIATQVVEADRSLLANNFSGFEYNYWYLTNGSKFSNISSGSYPIPPGICPSGTTLPSGGTSAPCSAQSSGLGEPFTVSQNINWVTAGSSWTLEIDAMVSWGSGAGAGSVDVRTSVNAPSFLMADPNKSYSLSSLCTSMTGFPTTGQVQAYAVSSDSSNLASLGQVSASDIGTSGLLFLLNNDTSFDTPSGVAFTNGSKTAYCPFSGS